MIGGVVLAAGASRRAGTAKALARARDGRALVAIARETLLAAGVDEVVVVASAELAGEISALLAAQVVVPHAPARSMRASLEAGLGAARGQLVVVSLVDHPSVRAATVRALIERASASGAPVTRPRYQGRRGHPYVLGPRGVLALMQADAARSARDVFRAMLGALDVDVDDPAVVEDLDTPALLAAAGVHVAEGPR